MVSVRPYSHSAVRCGGIIYLLVAVAVVSSSGYAAAAVGPPIPSDQELPAPSTAGTEDGQSGQTGPLPPFGEATTDLPPSVGQSTGLPRSALRDSPKQPDRSPPSPTALARSPWFGLISGLASILGLLLALYTTQIRTIPYSLYRSLAWRQALLSSAGLGVAVAAAVNFYRQGSPASDARFQGALPDSPW